MTLLTREQVFPWVESTLGGKIVDWTRQGGRESGGRPGWFIALERCCQQQLMIEATGHEPIQVPGDRARYSREHVGSEYIGWLHFQPIYDQLAERQPDMFD